MVENFFTSSFNRKKYHEILIIHELKFKDPNLYNFDVFNNIEVNKKDHLTYIWIETHDLKNANFKPEIILDMIFKNEFQHYIFE